MVCTPKTYWSIQLNDFIMDALRVSPMIISSKLVTPKNTFMKNFIIWHNLGDKLISWRLFYDAMIYLIVTPDFFFFYGIAVPN